jgi:signal transduction histidine kinase
VTTASNYTRPAIKEVTVNAMPTDANATSHVKEIGLALSGILMAVAGFFIVGVFSDYFALHQTLAAFALSQRLSIDMFGAGAPVAVGVAAAGLLIGYFKGSVKRLAAAWAISVGLAFGFFRLTSEGVSGSPLAFALAASAVAVAVFALPKPRGRTQRMLALGLMATVCCVPLALFTVDLTYAVQVAGGVIGGKGLSDAVLIATLYAPLAAAAEVCAAVYVRETWGLLRKQQTTTIANYSVTAKTH